MWVTPPAGKRAAPTAGAVVRSKKLLFSTSIDSHTYFIAKIVKIKIPCSDISYRHFKFVAKQGFISCLLLVPGSEYIFDHLVSLVDIAVGCEQR